MSSFNKERWKLLDEVGSAIEKATDKYKSDAVEESNDPRVKDHSIIQALGIDLSDTIYSAIGEHLSDEEVNLVLYTLGYEILLKTGMVIEEAKKAAEFRL